MTDRLLGINRWLAAGGLLGLAAAAALYPAGLGASLPPYPLGEAEIVARARDLARARGLPAADAHAVGVTLRDDFAKLRDAVGLEEARRAVAAGEVPATAWRVRFREGLFYGDLDDDPAGLSVGLSATGQVLSVDDPKRPRDAAPARDEARAVALEGLGAFGVSLDGYAERARGDDPAAGERGLRIRAGPQGDRQNVEVQVDEEGAPPAPERPADEDADRREEKFVWERPSPARPGITERVSATVTSAGLSEFARGFAVDDAPPKRSELGEVFEATAFVFFMLLLGLTILGVGVFRLVARDYVSLRRALAAVGAFAVLCLAQQVVTMDFSESLVAQPVEVILLCVPLGILVALAWLVGETDAYRAWGRQATEGLLALAMRKPFARQVAREALEGTLLGWLMLGAVASAAALAALAWGPAAVRRPPDLFAVDARPSFLFALAQLPYAFEIMVLGHMFTGSRAQRLLKRAAVAVPVAGIGVGLLVVPQGLADVELGRLTTSLSWALGFGLVTAFAAARSGVLTAGVATFVFSSFYYGLAAATCGGPGDGAPAWAGLALAAAPAALAFAAGRWLPEAEIREVPTPRVTSMLEQARRAEELNIAHRVQGGLLPSKDPEVMGFDVSGRCRPASEVGGDYFDYFRLPDGRFGIAVGDVSGKGVPAAFFMTLTKGFMEVAAAESRGPDEVLSKANGYLRDHLAKGTFVTMAYAALDPESSDVTFARAGHNLPVLVRRGERPRLLEPPGVALGAARPGEFEKLIEPGRLALRRGDTLVLYTDGLTEAMNPAREQYGEERMLDALARLADGLPARELVDALFGEVGDFSRGAPQHDDITVVVVRAE